MKRLLPITCIAAVTALTACTREDDSLADKLDGIDRRLAGIEKAIARGGGAPGARAAGAQRQRPRGPDPQAVYSVPIEGDAYVGARDAKITVVKAFEFACPFCQKVTPTLDQLLSDYDGDIKIVYKHFVVHPQVATAPAQAACAAHRQGKFKQMYDIIWKKGFEAYRAERDPGKLDAEHMATLAGEIGLDVNKYKQDLQACSREIARDESQLRSVGISGTPGFFINGRYLRGAQPLPRFKAIIDEELKKANARIQKGEASAGDYYNKFVLDQGKKKL